MFQLHGRPGTTRGGRVTREDFAAVRSPAPLTYGWGDKGELPIRWFTSGDDIRDYLAAVDIQSLDFVHEGSSRRQSSSDLFPIIDSVQNYEYVESIFRQILSFPRVELARVAVLDVIGHPGPPYTFRVEGRDLPQVPSGGYYLDAIVDFDEEIPAPMGMGSLPLRRHFPLRLRISPTGLLLSTACRIVDELAVGTVSQVGRLDTGAPLFQRDEVDFDVFQEWSDSNIAPLLRTLIGPMPDLSKYLQVGASTKLRSVLLKLELDMHGIQVSDQELIDFFVSVRAFDDWLRSAH